VSASVSPLDAPGGSRRPCLIGIQLPEIERRVPWPEMVAIARRAEAVGVDSLWIGDHLLYDLPGGEVRGPWEVWTALAAIASVTERVEIGPLVASTGFHAPAMLAKMASTVDAISGGRLIAGIGAGWNEREYRAFGFPFDRRVARFGESVEVIGRLLAGERFSFHGDHVRVDDVVLDPPPVRPGGPPLLVGSIGPRMLGLARPWMSAWNVWFSQYGNTAEGFATVRTGVDEIIGDAGAGPEVAATAAVLVRGPGGGGRTMGEDAGRSIEAISGPVDEVADHLRAFAAAGAEHLQLVVDPITEAGVDWIGEVLDRVDA
jgi:alkanesulfonate monooxygenase SsuD/methylene tetrahydromethanopterin reductase-like flavin-dependent oxidoreductase (luciferase family)